MGNRLFQRPERASFISTEDHGIGELDEEIRFNALNGLLSFLPWRFYTRKSVEGFQRPERASFISTQ